jgi:hypothetical protein
MLVISSSNKQDSVVIHAAKIGKGESSMLFNHPVANKIQWSFMQLKIDKGVYTGRVIHVG